MFEPTRLPDGRIEAPRRAVANDGSIDDRGRAGLIGPRAGRSRACGRACPRPPARGDGALSLGRGCDGGLLSGEGPLGYRETQAFEGASSPGR